MQDRLVSLVEATETLKQISKEFCSFNNVKLKPITLANPIIPNNNIITPYKVIGVKYSILAEDDEPDYDSEECFEVVLSQPWGKSETCNQLAMHAQELLVNQQVPAVFNHYPIYRDKSGFTISEFSSEGDLVDFSVENTKSYMLADIKYLIAQLIKGLYNYHYNSLTHGDIKPENFLVFLLNEKSVIKYADPDHVIKVTDDGRAVTENIFYSGTKKYRAPELATAMLASDATTDLTDKLELYNSINWKAADCYSLGLTIGAFMKETLIREVYDDVLSKENLTCKNIESLHLRNIYAGLVQPDPTKRWTIEMAIQSQFFGETAEERKAYFDDVTDKAHYTLSFDGHNFEPPTNTLGDPFYILDEYIKKVYSESKCIVEQLMELNFYLKPTEIHYESVVKTYKELLIMISNFTRYCDVACSVSQTNYFREVLEKFEPFLHSTMSLLKLVLYEKLSPLVLICVDKAIVGYKTIGASQSPLQRNYLLATVRVGEEITQFRNEIVASIDCASTYALAQKFIPNKWDSYPVNSFQSVFAAWIHAILPESLEQIVSNWENIQTSTNTHSLSA